jgi:hypothetical protein
MRKFRERTHAEKKMLSTLIPMRKALEAQLNEWKFDLSHLRDVIRLRPVYDIVLRLIDEVNALTDTKQAMSIAQIVITTPTDSLFDELVKQGHIVGTKFMGVDYSMWAKRDSFDVDAMPDGIRAVFDTMLKLKGNR